MVTEKSFKVRMICSVLAIVISIVYIAATFGLRKEVGWWAFIDCFALFMSSFLWMISIVIGRIIPLSGKTIRSLAIAAFVLFLLSLTIECIAL